MDLDMAVRTAVESGKTELGMRRASKGAGKAKAVIVASNCPPEARAAVEAACSKAGVPVHVYPGTSLELGAVCGKPFAGMWR